MSILENNAAVSMKQYMLTFITFMSCIYLKLGRPGPDSGCSAIGWIDLFKTNASTFYMLSTSNVAS
jgi:hypothetical protein